MTNELLKSEMVNMSDETFRQKFFTTEGRINRMTYLKRNLFLFFMIFATLFAIEFFGFIADLSPAGINIICNIAMILFLVPGFCLDVKRLHDLGKDSTLAKIFLGFSIFSAAYNWHLPIAIGLTPIEIIISIASLGFAFYLLFARGEDQDNQYGTAQ